MIVRKKWWSLVTFRIKYLWFFGKSDPKMALLLEINQNSGRANIKSHFILEEKLPKKSLL
ncbi:hypothetical protein P872_04835 [Rhodonellum psychrophilum GCM71 = DSM 17998]|uniref:Uncharacterized protein n=1 Tax=Rhodonellum psychrophilum GCM71 = DSM 17998 TaxID=1123057 RepID=U5C1Z9_9BACT|nr:hypothetical protein P872_04835 [Rhodonellum psychrophilum GCM71 = DSM 17998]